MSAIIEVGTGLGNGGNRQTIRTVVEARTIGNRSRRERRGHRPGASRRTSRRLAIAGPSPQLDAAMVGLDDRLLLATLDGMNHARFGRETWSVLVPRGWRARHDDACATLVADEEVGALLFVTYTCSLDFQGVEDRIVNSVLESLAAHGGEHGD